MSNAKGFRGSQSYVWDISKPLGQGATSIVYIGRNKKTGDEVAVKVFNTLSHQRPMTVQLREFEVMKKLNHENIVKLIAVEEEVPNGVNVLIMEYCTHGNLYSLLEQPENNFGLVEEEFINVLQQITEGVRHLRDSDIIHRDIKPGNILRSVRPDGRSVYKLTDFGAARELQEDEEFYSLYGTDEYLHPAMYEKAVLRRARGQHFGLYVDLWSIGVTFYHAATGNLPFRPFGGRRNRETMHQITTKKEHGVISGVQWKENGPVEWSRDLPPTCRLSRGLKALVTPLLASLLEMDQAKTVTFEEFFAHVNDITSRIPYYMFCPSSLSLLTIYARPQDDMPQIRQLVTDQTEIKGAAQLMLYDGKVLMGESRESMASVASSHTKANPIFLFNKLPEFRGFRKPNVGVFMEIPITTCVGTDYPLSKKCLAVIYSMRNAVRTLKSCTEYLHTAVKMYSDHVSRKYLEAEQCSFYLTKASTDAAVFKDQLFQLVAVEGTLFRCLANTVQASILVRANSLQTMQQTANRECSHMSNQIRSKVEAGKDSLRDVKKGLRQDSSWDISIGCVPADRCPEKMDVLISRLQKIMSSFKEDRNKGRLNNNEEQIHRVDKNKMKELTVTAKTLLEDHCTRKAQALVLAFKKFYSKNVQLNDTVDKVSSDLKDLNDQHTRLMDKLKALSKDCISHANSSVKEVEKYERERSSNSSSSSIGTTSGSNETVPGEATGSRTEKLGSVLNSLQSWSENLQEVREMLEVNTRMISRFGENCPADMEEDKSWEMVAANNGVIAENPEIPSGRNGGVEHVMQLQNS